MITTITYLFFIYLILALFIERSVEIMVSVLRYADLKLGWYSHWNRLAEASRQRFDRQLLYQGAGGGTEKLLVWLHWDVVTAKAYEGGKDLISADAIRSKYIRITSRILAFLLAATFSGLMYLNFKTDLITIFQQVSEIELISSGPYLKVFLTAVLLSAGAEPLHQLIVKVENIGKKKSKKEADQ